MLRINLVKALGTLGLLLKSRSCGWFIVFFHIKATAQLLISLHTTREAPDPQVTDRAMGSLTHLRRQGSEISPCLRVHGIFFDWFREQLHDSSGRINFFLHAFQPTLGRFCQISRAWNAQTSKLLYEEIYLMSSISLLILAETLEENEHLRPLVHKFQFSGNFFSPRSSFVRRTVIDEYNEYRIHEACPNLVLYSDPMDWHKFLLFPKKVQPGIQDPGSITRLEIFLPTDTFSSTDAADRMEFPALWSLVLHSRKPNELLTMGVSRWHMPQLRCLTLHEFRIADVRALAMLEHSPLITEIELSSGPR